VSGIETPQTSPEPALELDRNPNPPRDELLVEPIRLAEDGTVAVPTGDGLGIAVNEEVLERYRSP
jgi:D-galactarolactone cycloisomerase